MMKDCMEAQGARWRDRSPERGRGLSSETDMGREGGRQADRQTEREAPQGGGGEALGGPQALSNLWHGKRKKKKKKRSWLHLRVCVHSHHRGERTLSIPPLVCTSNVICTEHKCA